jgi:hypothetical protein
MKRKWLQRPADKNVTHQWRISIGGFVEFLAQAVFVRESSGGIWPKPSLKNPGGNALARQLWKKRSLPAVNEHFFCRMQQRQRV